MITLTGGSWTDGETIDEGELFTDDDDDYPEYTGVFRISSGIHDGREKLAFRHNGDCYTISVIDVDDCEAGPTESNQRPCEEEAQFFGTYPSWTDQGTILYEPAERGRQHKRTGAYSCNYSDFINEWNPGSPETTTLVEGENPDAG